MLMEYVYRYIDDETGETVYVGISKCLKDRIAQHKRDKLASINKAIIEYFPVKYHADADMLETYLISHYDTGKYFNVSKTKKGKCSFIDICDKLPWKRFDGRVDKDIEPFTISSIQEKTVVEKVVEKPIVKEVKIRGDKPTVDQALSIYNEAIKYFKYEIYTETKIVEGLRHMIDDQKADDSPEYYEFLKKGLLLHTEREKILRLFLKEYRNGNCSEKSDKYSNLVHLAMKNRIELEEHEGVLYNSPLEDGWQEIAGGVVI